jgi:speckle-type POZ protein
MMDEGWTKDFWVAATNEKFTDVEIFVGTLKVMEVHRVILSARSPVLNSSLKKINKTAGKSIVTFGAEFEVDTVKNFLNFLYTGSLKTTDNVQQLSKLAAMYQVETLKNVCQPFQLINANPPDVEEVTDYLLQL